MCPSMTGVLCSAEVVPKGGLSRGIALTIEPVSQDLWP